MPTSKKPRSPNPDKMVKSCRLQNTFLKRNTLKQPKSKVRKCGKFFCKPSTRPIFRILRIVESNRPFKIIEDCSLLSLMMIGWWILYPVNEIVSKKKLARGIGRPRDDNIRRTDWFSMIISSHFHCSWKHYQEFQLKNRQGERERHQAMGGWSGPMPCFINRHADWIKTPSWMYSFSVLN